MRKLIFALCLLVLAPLARADDNPSLGSAIGWTLAKRALVTGGGGLAGGIAGKMLANWAIRTAAIAALGPVAPAVVTVTSVAMLAVTGAVLANWIYNQYREYTVRAAARRAPTPSTLHPGDITDNQPGPPAGGRPGPAPAAPAPDDEFDSLKFREDFPR